MTTISTIDEALASGAERFKHVGCGKVYSLAALAEDLWLGETLVCWTCRDSDRGSGYGFVPAPRPQSEKPASAFMGGARWAPVPDWLLRQEGPALSDRERAVVLALWSFQQPDADTWRDVTDIAKASGRGVRQTREILRRLEERGFLRRTRTSRTARSHYDIRPLMCAGSPEAAVALERRTPASRDATNEATNGATNEAASCNETAPERRTPASRRGADSRLTDVETELHVETTLTSGSAGALILESQDREAEPSPPQREANVNSAGEGDDSDRPPAAFVPVAVGVELGGDFSAVAVEQPAVHAPDEPGVAEAVGLGEAGADRFVAAGDDAGRGTGSGEGFGIGHTPEDTPPGYDEFPAPRRPTLLDRLGSEDAVVAVVAAAFDAEEEDERPDPERRREELLAKGDELALLLRDNWQAAGGRWSW